MSFAEHRSSFIRWGIVPTLGIGIGIVAWQSYQGDRANGDDAGRAHSAKVKRVISGHSVKLKSGERLNYAGIRAPYDNEPFYDEARKRNAELVEGKRIRLRFDLEERDKKGRLQAHVFAGGRFINEVLVRDGLAYVRLTPVTDRFAETLLTAQKDARRNRRGIWKRRHASTDKQYIGDPKYGNFHRAKCEEVPKIKADRKIVFRNTKTAFDQGYAPCKKCRP